MAGGKRSWAAFLAGVLGAVGLLDLVAGPLLAYFGLGPPMLGFGIFALGALSGLLALLLGAVGLLRTGAGSRRAGRGLAWLGVVAGVAVLGTVLTAALPGRGLPRINDITTNPADPPTFEAAQRDPANQGRSFEYDWRFADQQRGAYPDLEPILLVERPQRTLKLVRGVAEGLGWELVELREDEGVLEARDVSGVFRFVDDVVVRVTPGPGQPAGSVVDVRSRSRDGRGDLGVNARRIRAFSEALRRAASS